MNLEPLCKTAVEDIDQQVIISRRSHTMSLEPPHKPAVQVIDKQVILSEAPPQNIYISMPPRDFVYENDEEYEISRRTAQRLNRFAGTAIQRGTCHVGLDGWGLPKGFMAVLRGFCGFEIVRVEWVKRDEEIWDSSDWIDCWNEVLMSHIEDELGMALGKAEWKFENTIKGAKDVQVVIAAFRPREPRQ